MPTGKFLIENGILCEYNNVPVFFDEPKFYTLVGDLADPAEPRSALFPDDPQLGKVGGTGFSFERAQVKFVGEAIERYSLIPTSQDYLHGSYDQLAETSTYGFLDPSRVAGGAGPDGKRGQVFAWSRAAHMMSGSTIIIPSHLVDVPAIFKSGDAFVRGPITTGAASHTNETQAKLSGIYEVWERDLLMSKWLKSESPHRVTLPTELPSYLAKVIAHIRRYRMTVRYYSLGAPSGFFAYICYLFDPTGFVPFTIGAAFHDDPEIALVKATEEAVQARPWLRIIKSSGDPLPRELLTVRDRALWSMTEECGRTVRKWLNGSTRSAEPIRTLRGGRKISTEELLSDIINLTLDRGATPLHVSLTPRLPSAVRAQFFACRVVVPEFQPLYFNEAERPSNLLTLKEGLINRVPHPFL